MLPPTCDCDVSEGCVRKTFVDLSSSAVTFARPIGKLGFSRPDWLIKSDCLRRVNFRTRPTHSIACHVRCFYSCLSKHETLNRQFSVIFNQLSGSVIIGKLPTSASSYLIFRAIQKISLNCTFFANF